MCTKPFQPTKYKGKLFLVETSRGPPYCAPPFNRERFKCDLEMENWSSVFDSNDVNESYSRFLHIFNKVSNNHAPLKLGPNLTAILKC